MSEIERLLKHYDGVVSGAAAWHGDPVWQILDGIAVETTVARPVHCVHTIWEIVTHMTFWENVATKRLRGVPDWWKS